MTFQCLGDLTLRRPLDIQCFVKAPQRPDIRHRKCLEDAIEQLQGQRLWSLLNRYRLPSLLRDRGGNQVNPLLLALQSGSSGVVRTGRGSAIPASLCNWAPRQGSCRRSVDGKGECRLCPHRVGTSTLRGSSPPDGGGSLKAPVLSCRCGSTRPSHRPRP